MRSLKVLQFLHSIIRPRCDTSNARFVTQPFTVLIQTKPSSDSAGGNMYRKVRRNFILSAGMSLVALLVATGSSPAQKPAPSPSPAEPSNDRFSVTASAEFGVRGLEVNGD